MKTGLFWEQPLVHKNPLRFFGAICKKHALLQGERRRLDGECCACHRMQKADDVVKEQR